jgi:arginine-tRNA-protein transferase
MSLQNLRLLLGASHLCGYLPTRAARSAFVDPALKLDPAIYGSLLDNGFRRSGDYAYRPMCVGCRACRSVRVAVQDFVPNRSQRRCAQRNAGVQLRILDRLGNEHYELYRAYLKARHPDGGMDPDDGEAFREFLGCGWGTTEFWELREGQQLLAVSVVDRVPRGFSAVYTFFDPAQPARGLGTYAILRQVQSAREEGLPYLYLGYWVAGSDKMDYKKNFQPLEILQVSGWVRIAAAEAFADNAAT